MRTPAFNEGQLAAKNGREFWENPYSAPDSDKTAFQDWQRGWCFGQRILAEKWAQATHRSAKTQ